MTVQDISPISPVQPVSPVRDTVADDLRRLQLMEEMCATAVTCAINTASWSRRIADKMTSADPMAAAIDWLDAYRAGYLFIVDLYAEMPCCNATAVAKKNGAARTLSLRTGVNGSLKILPVISSTCSGTAAMLSSTSACRVGSCRRCLRLMPPPPPTGRYCLAGAAQSGTRSIRKKRSALKCVGCRQVRTVPTKTHGRCARKTMRSCYVYSFCCTRDGA